VNRLSADKSTQIRVDLMAYKCGGCSTTGLYKAGIFMLHRAILQKSKILKDTGCKLQHFRRVFDPRRIEPLQSRTAGE